ncbi:MAG: SusC/RagA family TonB-linked outer membrane protein [Candidatus Pseudobacter hemicellulosilyticus]|uniref:SusC/RagA family TonB-linked outer membrane protein n=1 Tax=Candidatus Pseudobacter hemicellulosilyticus TaxID=3121375 RepID=A0AAJ6BI23_9BACT|nr:MAG: SusC/RagA family TonB-linked outer membrane protein [Pseudobacter sp.]
MRKILSLLAVLVLFTVPALAQPRFITGQIKDNQGDPIPFTSVTVKSSGRGVTSDENGNFRIQASTGDVLVFSAVGAQTSEVTVGASDVLNVTLTKTGNLEEVVVTALGVQRQARELGYSTARIRNSELNQAKTVNLQNGLTGKVSGLSITTVNSGVFEDTKINLRGLRSLTGNNSPLLVVDNIPTPLSYITTLNPNDVQDVNVLKGASAAAIYGPDGVNGVILVRTKRGSSGKPTVTVSHTVQLARVSFMPKVQERFGGGTSEDAYGRALYDPIENQQYGPEFDGSMVDIGPELEDGDIQRVPYSATDDRKKFWQNGLTLQTDISLSAQGFYLSAQDADIRGLMPKDKNRRTSLRINASKEYGKLKVSGNLSYIQQNSNVVNDGAYAARFPGSYNGSVYFTVLNTPAHVPLTQYQDWRNAKYAQYSNYYNEYFVNPYWVIDNHRIKARSDNFLANADATYKFAEWLNATYRVGAALAFSNFKSENGPVITSDYAQSHRGQGFDPQPAFVADGEEFNSRVTHEFFFNGRKEVRDFAFNYILGTRYRQNDVKTIRTGGNNLQINDLYNNSVRLGEAVGAEANYRTRLVSVFGQLSLSYKGWANIEFSAANDWDSRLNIDNNSFFYPGVSASLVLSDVIPFLQSNPVISYLKIRGAVSKSANVNLGRADNSFTGAYTLAPVYTATNGFPYGNLGGFSAGNVLTNPLIEPEFVNAREVGMEISFLNNRINLDATYFHQKNTNQILGIQQSSATGYTTYYDNAADFNNYGVEMDLNLTPLVKLGNVSINLGFNATYNDNKIVSLFPGIDELSIGGSNEFTQRAASSPTATQFAIVGNPAFVFKLSDYKRDAQGRVIVDRFTGYPSLQDSLVTRGRSLPTWILGINPSVTWKGLTVAMTWDYRGGHYVYHGIGSDMDFTGISARSAQYGRQRFVFPNSVYDDGTGKYVTNENVQVSNGGRNFWATGTTNTSVATNYFTSAAFWKLRELAIAYEVTLPWIGENKVFKRLVVAAVGRNLLTLLPKSNEWTDPEFNYTTNNNTFGINSVFSTPPARTFGASVTVTF